MNANELVLSIWQRKNGQTADMGDWLTRKQTDYLRDLSTRPGSGVQSSAHGTKGNVGHNYWGSLYRNDVFVGTWNMAVSPVNGCGGLKVSKVRNYTAWAHTYQYNGVNHCFSCWESDLFAAVKLPEVVEREVQLTMLQQATVEAVVTEQPTCSRCGKLIPTESKEV